MDRQGTDFQRQAIRGPGNIYASRIFTCLLDGNLLAMATARISGTKQGEEYLAIRLVPEAVAVEGEDEDKYQPRQAYLENLFPRLVVFCLLLSSLSFTPTKRYEEVDGVRKEKERLTTDHQPPNSYLLFSWCEGK